MENNRLAKRKIKEEMKTHRKINKLIRVFGAKHAPPDFLGRWMLWGEVYDRKERRKKTQMAQKEVDRKRAKCYT
jgi:hypothetical protein